jgi:hypothetical protein
MIACRRRAAAECRCQARGEAQAMRPSIGVPRVREFECSFIDNATKDHDRRMAQSRRLRMSKRSGVAGHQETARPRRHLTLVKESSICPIKS